MYKLLAKMKSIHGENFLIFNINLGDKHIDFLPLTYILPNELADL